jgi:hypothetical protein
VSVVWQLVSYCQWGAYFGGSESVLTSCFMSPRLVALLEGDPVPFATMYSIGNVLAICSSCFLYGPWTQMKQMFALTRMVTTVIYLTMLALTLFLVCSSAFSSLKVCRPSILGRSPSDCCGLSLRYFFNFSRLVCPPRRA